GPLTSADGLDATYLTSAPKLTNETPGQWASFASQPRPAPSAFTTGRVGATADASGVLDLGTPQRAIGLNLNFCNALIDLTDYWQNGGTVQVRASASDPWQTVYDTSKPMTTVSLNWAAAPKAVRYVRFINKY